MSKLDSRSGSFISSVTTSVRNNILAGVAVLLPVMLTVAVIAFLVNQVNRLFLNPAVGIIRPFVPWLEVGFLTVTVKILVFIIILMLLAFLGLAARTLLVRRLIKAGENILGRIPLVRNVYSSFRQLSDTFITQKQNIFHRAVLTEYPRKGVYVLGLVTSESRGEIQEKTTDTLINVFIPTTPNPTSGFLLMVPKAETIPLDMTVEESMKLIISGGAITPEFVRRVKENRD